MGIRTGMSYTLRSHRMLPLLGVLLAVLAPGVAAGAQEPARTEGFERQYLRAEPYRTGSTAGLADWPALGELVRGSREL